MLLITVSAVDGATLCRLEWNFTFFATVRAGCFMHLSWAAVETAPSSITHLFHSFSSDMPRIPVIIFSAYTPGGSHASI